MFSHASIRRCLLTRFAFLSFLVAAAPATFPDGATYDGQYKNGLREGTGKYTFAGGKGFYSGDWVAGERHGVGTQRYPDKSRYVGEWRSGLRHGRGTYTYPNGDRYCGSWENDVRSGPGTYLYQADQTSFSGEWKEGQCREGEWAFHDKAPFVANVVAGKVTHYVQGK